jgi:gliding motility-associated-like protein
MKKLINYHVLLAFVLLLSVFKSSAQCQPETFINLSTGINSSGALLPTTGIVDPYWKLVNVAPPSVNGSGGISIPNAYTVPSNSPLGWIVVPGAVALNVINSTFFSTNNTIATQPWVFRRKFSVTTAGTINFNGAFMGDDKSVLKICNSSGTVLRSYSQAGWSTLKSIQDSLQMSAGCYYLEVELVNVSSGKMGFAVNLIGSTTGLKLANPNQGCCNNSLISGQKLIDQNCDGKQGQNDIPAASWVFELKSGAAVLQTATSDVYGQFFFNDVPNGTYTISEIAQAGYTASFPSGGSTSITINNATNNGVQQVLFLNCKDSVVTTPNNCAQIINPVVSCDKGQYYMDFRIKNNSTWEIKGLTLKNLNPNITAVSTTFNGSEPFFDIADILPTVTSPIIRVPLYVAVYSPNACFDFTFCDVNDPKQPTANCCTMDSICVDVPVCQGGPGTPGVPCDSLAEMGYLPADSTGNCCFNLSLNYMGIAANLQTISFTGLGGTEFVLTGTSGWAYTGISSASYREITAPIGGYPAGTYTDIIKMCVTSANPAPHKVLINYTDANGIALCEDTIAFEQCKVVPPSCATIINDSLYCENGKAILKFNIVNNSNFPVRQLDFFVDDSTYFNVTPNKIQLAPSAAIAVGATAGPFTVQVDTTNGGATNFCLQVSAHNNIYDSLNYATQCCSDAIRKVCLPFIECVADGCCDFAAMTIPNGITPNGDGKNDLWVITKPASCDSIKITVFNRWGNIVYKDANYLNNWGGTNQNGDLLPQSTYFVVIELSNGSKKGLYVDVRY